MPNTPVVKDIREESQVEELEDILDKGPLAVVLIYADWCGHCERFKPMWEKLAKTTGKKANMISVNEQILPQTSLARANIDGYPSTVIVEKGSRHREFPAEEAAAAAPTNSFPAMRDMKVMEKLVRGELTEDEPIVEAAVAAAPSPPKIPTVVATQPLPLPLSQPQPQPQPQLPQKKNGIFDFVPNMMGGTQRRRKSTKRVKRPTKRQTRRNNHSRTKRHRKN